MKSTEKITVILTIVTIVMFGFSFFIAPLYSKFCKVTGITTIQTEKDFFAKEDATRTITIQFIATNNEKLAWEFFPVINSVKVHPNQTMRIYFHVKNNTNHTMTVQAIPSYAPLLSMRYFHKIECFCFRQQTLNAGVAKDMPVVFRVSGDLPKEIHTITLAYTLFDVTPQKRTST